MSNENGREMPKYKCHKVVRAMRISAVVESDDGAIVHFHEIGFKPIAILEHQSHRFKFKDEDGNLDTGYYVVYEGGYVSWSPTKEFEEGYTRL